MLMTVSGPKSTRGFALSRVCVLAALGLLLLASAAGAQIPGEFTSSVPSGEGWLGFKELDFLLDAFLNLILAAVLGAVIGYHPRRIRTADTLEEIEAPKVSIVYAVIGSLIGILVVKYGTGMGFVLFGIGALIRFRTVMRSAQLTGQVIFVTLIGLTCGLHLPHVAVLATLFDFVLTFLLEARVTYRVDVRGLPLDRFAEAAGAYRAVLAGRPFRVLSETAAEWPHLLHLPQCRPRHPGAHRGTFGREGRPVAQGVIGLGGGLGDKASALLPTEAPLPPHRPEPLPELPEGLPGPPAQVDGHLLLLLDTPRRRNPPLFHHHLEERLEFLHFTA